MGDKGFLLEPSRPCDSAVCVCVCVCVGGGGGGGGGGRERSVCVEKGVDIKLCVNTFGFYL